MTVELGYKPFKGKNIFLHEDIFNWEVHEVKTTRQIQRGIILSLVQQNTSETSALIKATLYFMLPAHKNPN